MSEYTNVEHPFLEKLREIKWQVIDKGSGGIPQDPAESMCTSFSEVVLKDEFFKKLGELNPWITAEQKEYCYHKITDIDKPLTDANREIYNMLLCQCAGVDFKEHQDNIISVTDQVMTLIYAAKSISNIWTKTTNVNDLRGKIGKTLRFLGI